MDGQRSDEEFYDEEIAPILRELGEKCEERGIGFAAAVELTEAGSLAETVTYPEDSGFSIQLVHMAIQSGGNVDQLITGLTHHKRAHESIYLRLLDKHAE